MAKQQGKKLKKLHDPWQFDPPGRECVCGRFSDASARFCQLHPEVDPQDMRINLVLISSVSNEIPPDFFWLCISMGDDYVLDILPVFQNDCLDNFHGLAYDKCQISLVFDGLILRQGIPYVITSSQDHDLIFLKPRMLLSTQTVANMMRLLYKRECYDCHPVKGYSVSSGKYVGVFWVIKPTLDECIRLSVDSHLKQTKENSHIYCLPINNGECVVIGRYYFRAVYDENGFSFVSTGIKITDDTDLMNEASRTRNLLISH